MPVTQMSVPPVEEIVDRDEQLSIFKGIVGGEDERQLMFIRAEEGYGTSCLLQLVREHCRANAIPCCYIDFGPPDAYDAPHLTLAREICEQLGLVPRHLAEAVRPLSTYSTGQPSGSGAIAQGQGAIAAGMGGVAVGGNVQGDVSSNVVNQVIVNVSLTEEALHKAPLKQRLKRGFAADLSSAEGPLLVCLFDTIQKASTEESAWLLEALLQPVRDGRLEHVIVITGGKSTPDILVWEWLDKSHLIKDLPPLTEEDIQELGRRLGYELSKEEAHSAWRSSGGGIPLLAPMAIKNWIATRGLGQ